MIYNPHVSLGNTVFHPPQQIYPKQTKTGPALVFRDGQGATKVEGRILPAEATFIEGSSP